MRLRDLRQEEVRLSRLLARLLASDPVRAGDLSRVPRQPGVYAFLERDRVLYAGKSDQGLRTRMREHTWPTAETLLPGRKSRPMCQLALRLAETTMDRKVAGWPPPREDRAAILDALRRVRDMEVCYVLEPDRRVRVRLEWYAQAVLDPEYNG